jgi:hypothetical protein
MRHLFAETLDVNVSTSPDKPESRRPPAADAHNFVRHRCRNPRCGAKLKAPVENSRDAFCCTGCFSVFYRNRCLVCEAALSEGPANREICRRAKCRQELRKFPHLYRRPKNGERPPRNAHSTGPKIVAKPGLGPRDWPRKPPREVIETEVFGGRSWRPVISSHGVSCEVSVLRPRALINGNGGGAK